MNDVPHRSSPERAQSSHHTPVPVRKTYTWPLEREHKMTKWIYTHKKKPHKVSFHFKLKLFF